MRYNILTPDGREIGYITDTPEFQWAIEKRAPFRESIVQVINQSKQYQMVVTGGDDPAEDAVTPPEEEVDIDDRGRLIRLASELPGEAPVQIELAEDMDKGHIAEELTNLVDKSLGKERIYVDSPDEVPEGVEPQEGEEGGMYYDTEQLGDEDDASEPWEDASFNELGQVLQDTVGEDQVSALVEELPDEATPGTAIEQLTNMMAQSDEYDDSDINELYQELGAEFGDMNPEDAPAPEEVGVDVPDMDMATAVGVVGSVMGEEAANVLLGDLNASDSGEAPNPETYVTSAAHALPREARGQLQEALNQAGESESDEDEEEEQESDEDEEEEEESDEEDDSDDEQSETDETDETVDDSKSFPTTNESRDAVVEVDKLQNPGLDISTNKGLRKVGENFKQVDDMLMEAFEKQIWQDDMTKAPNMWQRDDEVPQFVRSHVQNAIENTNTLHDNFDNIPHAAALKVHGIIKDQLTDPQGWSIETVTKALSDEFDQLTLDKAEDIARTEIASVLNKARELAYDAAQAAAARNESRNITGLPDRDGGSDEGEEKVGYYWAGPEDHDTTNICSETKDEIERRGGYVSKDELKEILREKAKKYEKEDGGLPNRVDSFMPHFQCRHTFIREDYQRIT